MKTDLIIKEPDLYFDSIHQELNNFLNEIHSWCTQWQIILI